MKKVQNLNLQNFNVNTDDSKKNHFHTHYYKESEEEIENNNLFAYELFEKADAIDIEDKNSRRESEPNLKIYKSYSSNSSNNLISKKTTPYSNATCQVVNNKNIMNSESDHKYRKNIMSSNINYEKKLREMSEEQKQFIIKELLNVEIEKKRKNINYSKSNQIERVKSSESRNNDKICLTYGERLYNRGLAFREKSIKNINVIRNKQRKIEMKECTFTPTLYHSSSIFSNTSNKLGVKSTFSSLLHSNTYNNLLLKSRGKFNNLNSNTERELHKNDSKNMNKIFSSVDKTGEQFNSKKKRSESEILKFSNKLFNDAERQKFHKEKLVRDYYNDNCPFKPTINDTSQREKQPRIENFFFRLQKWVDKRNEKYVMDMNKANYDNKTGLRLFSPNIRDNSSKRISFNDNHRNKFVDLFVEWKKREAKSQELQVQQLKENREMANLVHTSPKSRELSLDVKKKIFQKIFEIIVDPIKNVVNGDVKFTNLPEKIYLIFSPLIQELHDQNETLSNLEFSRACDHLYKILSIDQKQYLCEWYFSTIKKKREIEENQPFKPEINKNSEKILSTKFNFQNNFYLRSMEFLKNKEQKLTTEIEKRKLTEISEECTFHPNLIKNNYSSTRGVSYYYNKFKDEENNEIS